MLLTKTTPVGIDVPIQKFQEWLHTQLVSKWGLTGDDTVWRCYGRCYRNQTKDGYVAEAYEGGGKYREVYWDSKLTAISFFGMGTNIDTQTGNVADVHLVFFTDVSKLKPSITHRADEEVKKDVRELVGMGMFGFTLEGITTGVENVLREYPGNRRDERLKYVDMHPVHCFRFNFKVRYKTDIKFC